MASACPQLASTEKGNRGREGILCPELFSPGACHCNDVFLAMAIGGETLKEGFGLLLLICPPGNAQNLSMVSSPGWKEIMSGRGKAKQQNSSLLYACRAL